MAVPNQDATGRSVLDQDANGMVVLDQDTTSIQGMCQLMQPYMIKYTGNV